MHENENEKIRENKEGEKTQKWQLAVTGYKKQLALSGCIEAEKQLSPYYVGPWDDTAWWFDHQLLMVECFQNTT